MSATPVTAPAAERPRRRAATAAIALVAATLAGSIGSAGPAQAAQAAPTGTAPAAPAECRPGRNGFVATPRYVPMVSTRERIRLPSGRVTLELRQGRLDGRLVYWARVLGALRPADQFWLDWSRDGGRTFLRCGPFRVGPREVAAWTPSHAANPAARWAFRAGARLAPPDGHTVMTRWRS